MIQYLIAPNGQFIQKLEGTAQEILSMIPEGHDTTILPPPRTTDYWNGTTWVHIGPQPAWYMQFNYDTKQWEDSRNIEEVRRQKWEEVKLARNQFEFGGFIHEGMHFDSDQISQGRILAAVLFGESAEWTLADDTVVELNKEQITALGQALQQHVQTAHARGRVARRAINEATTIPEIEAVFF